MAIGEQPLTVHVLEVFLQPPERPGAIGAEAEDVVPYLGRLRSKPMRLREEIIVDQPQEMGKFILIAVMRCRRKKQQVVALAGQLGGQVVTPRGNDFRLAANAAAAGTCRTLVGL